MTRILSLDDEADILDLLRLILERVGYTVLTARNEYDAWATLRTTPVDLFTQDLVRPGDGGWEFFRRMQADPSLRHIPVVIITANADAHRDAVELGITGIAAYLFKPFKPHELLITVADVLVRWDLTLPPAPAAIQDLEPAVRRAVVKAMLYAPAFSPDEFAEQFPPVVLEELRRISSGQPALQLLRALREGHRCTRWIAACALGELRDRRAVPSLIDALRDSDERVRWAAAQALGALRDRRAVQPLIAALQDRSAQVVREAAFALGRLRDRRALHPLRRVAARALHFTDYGRMVAPAAHYAIGEIVQTVAK